VSKLLMLTGQRRGEIEYMVLDGTVATISGKSTKNKRTHTWTPPITAWSGAFDRSPVVRRLGGMVWGLASLLATMC
jgi:hypothetical protein